KPTEGHSVLCLDAQRLCVQHPCTGSIGRKKYSRQPSLLSESTILHHRCAISDHCNPTMYIMTSSPSSITFALPFCLGVFAMFNQIDEALLCDNDSAVVPLSRTLALNCSSAGGVSQ